MLRAGGKTFVQNVLRLAAACLIEFSRVRGIRREHLSKFGRCSSLHLIGLRYRSASRSLNVWLANQNGSAAFAKLSWEVPTASITF